MSWDVIREGSDWTDAKQAFSAAIAVSPDFRHGASSPGLTVNALGQAGPGGADQAMSLILAMRDRS